MEHNKNFTGTINRSAAESMIAWTSEPSQLRRKPNIVMIVLGVLAAGSAALTRGNKGGRARRWHRKLG